MLNEMASRAEPGHRTGSPAVAALRHAALAQVNRQEYEGQVVVDPWEEEALAIFYRFLLTRVEPFTTPEHLWPLIEAPGEMRKMVSVVRRALRGGWIREVGATRLTGTYFTLDHREFKMNKLVPLYQSLLPRGSVEDTERVPVPTGDSPAEPRSSDAVGPLVGLMDIDLFISP